VIGGLADPLFARPEHQQAAGSEPAGIAMGAMYGESASAVAPLFTGKEVGSRSLEASTSGMVS